MHGPTPLQSQAKALQHRHQNQQHSAMPLTQPEAFPLFPHLPFELRTVIWQHAVLSTPPRIIRPQHNALPTLPVPSLLHTCHESRAKALTRYKTYRQPTRLYYLRAKPYIYIDLHTDIFVVGLEDLGPVGTSYLALHYESQRDATLRDKIQHVLVSGKDWREHLGDYERLYEQIYPPKIQLLNAFTSLKTVSISAQDLEKVSTERRLRVEEYKGPAAEWDITDIAGRNQQGKIEYYLTAEEALETVSQSVPGWKLPIVKVVSVVAGSS